MRKLFFITWPIFIELFLHIATGSIDVFMLSRVSDEAVAAVGAANQIVFFCIILFGFVAMGTTVVVAQYVGAQKHEDASRIGAVSITMNLILGILVSLLLFLFHEPLLSIFRLKSELQHFGSIYLMIVGGFIFIEAVMLTISATIKSYGFTRDAMLIVLGVNILNIIGNYLFIFGAFGVPQLGVTGVAISTAVSRFIGLIIFFIILYKRLPVRVKRLDFIRIRRPDLQNIFRIGLPGAGEHVAWQTSQMMILSFISILGTTAMATHIYTFQILLFVMLCGLAIGQGTEIIIGQMVGAGKKEEAYRQLFHNLWWSQAITLIVVLCTIFFREKLFHIFTGDHAIIATGATLLLFTLILEPGRTFNLVVINALRATGDAKFPVVMGVLSMWGISVPLSYLFGIHWGWGLPGIYIAFVIDEWLRGVLMLIRWRSRVWERHLMVDTTQNS